MHTIRVRFLEKIWSKDPTTGKAIPHLIERNQHVLTLCNDPVRSKEKAIRWAESESVSLNTDVFSNLGKIERSQLMPFDITFGKHKGNDIREIDDHDWLWWAFNNCKGKFSPESVAFLEELFSDKISHEIALREQTEKERTIRIELLSPIVEKLTSKRAHGSFVDSICKDLENGIIPSGRGLDITADIFAKTHGRRNSKAHSDALDLFWGIIELVA